MVPSPTSPDMSSENYHINRWFKPLGHVQKHLYECLVDLPQLCPLFLTSSLNLSVVASAFLGRYYGQNLAFGHWTDGQVWEILRIKL